MITCSKEIHFCCAHRIFKHEGKCANLHGHNYKLWVEASGDSDSLGRVVDFSVIKEKLGSWIDQKWDHATLIYHHDGDMMDAVVNLGTKRDVVLFNTTAENMANYILKDLCPILFKDLGIKITKVKLFETDSCYAKATL